MEVEAVDARAKAQRRLDRTGTTENRNQAAGEVTLPWQPWVPFEVRLRQFEYILNHDIVCSVGKMERCTSPLKSY